MKTKFLILIGLAATSIAVQSAAPNLRIAQQSSNTIRIDWNSQVGVSYQILGTTNADSFAFWTPYSGTITAAGTNTVAVGPATNAMRFFKLHTLGQSGSGKPSVQITSHTNGQIVSGLTRLTVAAGDDSRLSYVSLYVDGKHYEDSITAGDLYWMLNTGAFSNGLHTLQAVAGTTRVTWRWAAVPTAASGRTSPVPQW